MEFGAVLRKMRKGAGMSQETLAERLHMSRSNISKFEGGKLDLRAKDFLNWVKQTNSQDILIALACNVDIASAGHVLSQLTQLAGTILLGVI